jgi:hypothetical protein
MRQMKKILLQSPLPANTPYGFGSGSQLLQRSKRWVTKNYVGADGIASGIANSAREASSNLRKVFSKACCLEKIM